MKSECWCGHGYNLHEKGLDLICRECKQNCETQWLKMNTFETSLQQNGSDTSQNGEMDINSETTSEL